MSHTTTFNRTVVSTLASLTLLVAAGNGFAQTPTDYSNTPPGPFHHPVAPLPLEQGFTQDHASTAAEGFLRGKAQVIQARGNFLLSESQSRILRQQARWLDRENDLKQTQALLTQKKMWSDARTQEQKDRQTRSNEGQQLLAARQASVYRQAYQLSARDLDPISGALNWPAILQTEQLGEQCDRIGELVREQIAYGDPQPATAREIARAVDLCSRTLRSAMNTMPREEYLAAQKFLVGIKYSTATPGQMVANARPIVPQPIAGVTLANK